MGKAREYLEGIKKLDRGINEKIEKLAQLKTLAESTTVAMGGERVSSSGSKERMAECTTKIIMMKQEINDDIDRFVDYKNEAKRLIKTLRNRKHREIIYKKYFKYKSLYRIASEKGWDYENTKHMHKKALNILDETLHIALGVDITPKM